MALSNAVLHEIVIAGETGAGFHGSLDELLCSPALASARSCLRRLDQVTTHDSAQFLERMLIEEDAMNQVVDQIRLQEVLGWREAEYRANCAAHRVKLEQSDSVAILDSTYHNAPLDIHYEQEALRCDATQFLLCYLADQAELLLGTARHWRTQAAHCADSGRRTDQLRAAQESLARAASLIVRGYMGEIDPVQADCDDDGSLVLPKARQF